MHSTMGTTEIFLIAMLVIFTLPYLIWRLGNTLMQGADIPMAGIVGNLVWVSLGNIIGGAGGVALAYRFAFLRGQP